jgi:hypothetical protein
LTVDQAGSTRIDKVHNYKRCAKKASMLWSRFLSISMKILFVF